MTYSQKLKQYWHHLERKLIPPYVWEMDLLTLWRERIIFIIFFTAAALGPFALIPSLVLAFFEKLWAIFILDSVAYALVLFTLFFPGVSLRHKTWIAFSIFYFLGTGLLFMIGFYGAGYIWLFGASLIVGGMIGIKEAVIALMLNFLSLLSVGVYIGLGSPEWAGAADNSVEKWLVMTANFMLINSLVTITVAAMLSILKDALSREQKITLELEKNRQELMAIFKASPDPVIVYDNHRRVQYTNDAFTNLFGWQLSEIKGNTISFIPEGQRSIPMEIHSKGADKFTDSDMRFETKRYTKDGAVLDIALSAALITDIKKNVVGMVINLKDITESKKLEAKLQQAQKMEAIGTLAGGIAHDFNNILQAITGFTQLLIFSKPKDDPDIPDLNEIMKASQRASSLIKQLMLFSRKVEPERTLISLNQVARDAKKILERTIPRMVSIKLILSNPLWHVQCDPIQMEQMLLNLCSNSADAIPHDGQITIETRNIFLDRTLIHSSIQELSGDYVLLTVSDTGQGIAPKDIDHIFEPFFTSKEIGKGTGLGLSSVYGIVKNHQGFITCTSNVNMGTQFKIYLPAIRSQPQSATVIPELTNSESTGNHETILIVDDDIQVQSVASKILKRNKYNIITASSGEEALEIFSRKRSPIDLILLDIGMPGMGGHKCLKELKQIDPDIKVLIASGYGAEGPISDTVEEGASGYIGKPYHSKDLLHRIRKIISCEKQTG